MDNVSWWKTTFNTKKILIRMSDSISNGNLSLGPVTFNFENRIAKMMDVPYCVTTTSGSVALLLAMMALGIKQGDEVIVPNRSWIATAHAPFLLGAKVVFVDVLSDLPIMDVSQIRKKITSRTKAILPVHLCGRSVDMVAVWDIANEFGLYVVEDAAQAMFSKNSKGYLGTQSHMGCFSLSMAKLISTGQGGFIVTKQKEIYEKLKLIRSHGVSNTMKVAWDMKGFNFRYNDIQASIGLEQLEEVNKRIDHLIKLYKRYEEQIRDIPFIKLIPVSISSGEVPLYIEILCEESENLAKFLNDQGIETRPFFPEMSSANYLNASNKVFPNARRFATEGLFLPSGVEQPLDNVDKVVRALRVYSKECVKQIKQ